MKNNFFAILLSLIISIGCTQETVINANIDEKLNNSGPTLKVQIKTENSRTIRPEVTKWEIKLFESNEQLTTRVLHGKDNTITTFTNVTTTEYKIKVYGYAVENDKDCKILYGEEVVKITSNETEMCVVTVNDNFETQPSENPSGILSVNISGLEDLPLDELGAGFFLKLAKLGDTSGEKEVDLVYESGKLSGKDDSIPVGSYKIENISFVHTDTLPTGEAGDSAAIDVLPINLIQDPIVNIYPGVTTTIDWTWNGNKDDVEEITQNNILKNTLVPVWNKPVDNRRAESSVPAKNGSLSANALFAEPTWLDGDKTHAFPIYSDSNQDGVEEKIGDIENIKESELEFINCAYDESGKLWVLSGTSDSKYFSEGSYYFCYVLRNLSSSENEEYEFTSSQEILSDFEVINNGGQKYLLVVFNNNAIAWTPLNKNRISQFNEYFSPNMVSYGMSITAIYAKGNNLYMAITENGNCTTANIYTGIIINESGDFARYGENNQPDPILLLGISDFTNETILNSDFYNSAFAISDMYINEDKTKLYVTAGCVCYQIKAWIFNENDYWGPHSFGGLFVYDIKEDDSLELSGKYGIYEGNDENNPFLKEAKPGEGIFELESNIMQAESETSSYFAGPRYIIPAGKDLLIVDSGFYGNLDEDEYLFIDCEKRNRIFTFDGSTLSAPIKLSDSISFDYDYLVNSYKIE